MTETEKELLIGLYYEKQAWEDLLKRDPHQDWHINKWNKFREPNELMEFSQLGLFRCNYKQILNRQDSLSTAETKRFQRASESLAGRGLIERVKWPADSRHVSHLRFTDSGLAEAERLATAELVA